jgi:hypothetical protein
MSNVSALSHEYRTSAKLAEELNSAIITIKKARLHRHSELSEKQRRQLTNTLDAVRSRLANEEKTPAVMVPQEVVTRLAERHKSKLAYLVEDLTEASVALSRASTPIEDFVVRLLDEICDVADQTASSMFRRMRRR